MHQPLPTQHTLHQQVHSPAMHTQTAVTLQESPEGPVLTQREYLPAAWSKLVSHRLLLQPVPGPPHHVMGQWQVCCVGACMCSACMRVLPCMYA